MFNLNLMFKADMLDSLVETSIASWFRLWWRMIEFSQWHWKWLFSRWGSGRGRHKCLSIFDWDEICKVQIHSTVKTIRQNLAAFADKTFLWVYLVFALVVINNFGQFGLFFNPVFFAVWGWQPFKPEMIYGTGKARRQMSFWKLEKSVLVWLWRPSCTWSWSCRWRRWYSQDRSGKLGGRLLQDGGGKMAAATQPAMQH